MLKRYRGSLLGLAVGDALGTTLEFRQPGSFSPLTDMVGGGPFNLEPGTWTDDTSMALCLAESLIQCRGYNPLNQMEKYLQWYRQGYLSSTGVCFDIGNTVRNALERFERNREPYCGSEDPRTAGNGSIMRLAPIPLLYRKYPYHGVELAAESSKTTHGAAEAVDGCRYLAALILGALMGLSKEEILSEHFTPVPNLWQENPLAGKINDIAAGSYKTKQNIRGTGYVADSLEAALWSFYHSSSFKEGALLAVNLGDDADTTGAVYGQLAGAYYGEDAIPGQWKGRIVQRHTIESLAGKLYVLSEEYKGF